MVIDASFVKRHIKPKADSTLLNMKKADLIEYIRTLEHNYNVAVSFNEQQARNIETMMKNGAIPSKWISVEDRLPEHGDVMLCHHKHTDYPIVCQWDERTGAWIDDKWSYGTGCITHWMPLPEPPKED